MELVVLVLVINLDWIALVFINFLEQILEQIIYLSELMRSLVLISINLFWGGFNLFPTPICFY